MENLSIPALSPMPTRLWSDSDKEWIEKPKKPKKDSTEEEKFEYWESLHRWSKLLENTTWYFEKKQREKKMRLINSSNTGNRRRARIKNLKNENINVLEVYEKNNWICQLCGYPVSKLLDRNLVDIASLDHIVPISKGGSHTYDNVQLAHLSCNIRKGNRINKGA